MGPLHGFPQAVKDLTPVKGIPMTQGSPILKDFMPPADSVLAERLRKAGAIMIGKTNTPEFGLGSHTYNPVYGVTRNPYDLTRSAGGSSGGAAVALALRMLPVADGTDYGGSLRNPAGWNNVFGFRTSFGRVPADGRDAWLPSMGVGGPMARNVADLALLLSVQAGYDARAPLSLAGRRCGLPGAAGDRPQGQAYRLGRRLSGICAVRTRRARCLQSGVEECSSRWAAVVEEAQPDYSIDAVWRAFVRLRAWQTGGTLLAFYNDPAKRALMKPEAIYEVESGFKLSAYDITAASAVRSEWYHAVRRFFERYDYFIVPTAQLFPFEIDMHWPQEIAGTKMQTYHEWMKGVLPVTMAGSPALAVPAGFGDRGLPIGIQIVGPNHADLACLQLAYAYDTATNWAARRPPPLLHQG